MQNRPAIPPQVSAIITQIDAVRNDPRLGIEHFRDLKEFTYRYLSAHHQHQQQKHSFAKWVHLAGRQDILDWLYQNTTDPSVGNNYFILHWAVLCRQPQQTITELATFKRANHSNNAYYRNNDPYLTKQDNDMTPLFLAVREGNQEIVRWLIESTGDAQASKAQITSPLHLAVKHNDTEMVNLLIQLGASHSACDKNGRTSLHLAMTAGHPDIISALVEHGADILAKDLTGITPVHLAMQKGEDTRTYLDLLKPKDLSWTNATNNSNITAFTLAAGNNQAQLLSHTIDQQYAVENNETGGAKIQPETFTQALRVAAKSGHVDVVELLLPHIPSIKEECADKPGTTLSIAAHGRQHDIVKALFRHLLTDYIIDRDSGPEFKKHTYFFVKKGAGYSKEKKIAAARALLAVVNGNAEVQTLNAHHGALHNKTLHGIYNLVDKFIFHDFQPPAVNAIEPTIAAPSANTYNQQSFDSRRQTNEFDYIRTAGSCCEASACLCSAAMGASRGGSCSIM